MFVNFVEDPFFNFIINSFYNLFFVFLFVYAITSLLKRLINV
jgi:hypothetical protein